MSLGERDLDAEDVREDVPIIVREDVAEDPREIEKLASVCRS